MTERQAFLQGNLSLGIYSAAAGAESGKNMGNLAFIPYLCAGDLYYTLLYILHAYEKQMDCMDDGRGRALADGGSECTDSF